MNYDYLNKSASPVVIAKAVELIGTREIVGSKHNPKIMSWAKELGLEKTYVNDEIPWCGLFVGVVVKRAGFSVVKDPLWARNWDKFGTDQKLAMFGDILTFTRPGGGGHVGFYVGEDKDCYHILGGNQSDSVNVTRILKSRCAKIRRCDWKIAQPKAVAVVKLSAKGEISKNES